jgi:hypothetical protein
MLSQTEFYNSVLYHIRKMTNNYHSLTAIHQKLAEIESMPVKKGNKAMKA